MDVESRRAFWASMRAFAARGRTVLFATHYLEEAECYADRAVLMAHGAVVAAAPTSEIRARVGRRTIPVSYTHLRAHETKANLVCRLLLEKKKTITTQGRS